MCLCLVQDKDEFADCARLTDDSKLWDMGCSTSYKTICQRDADQGKQYISCKEILKTSMKNQNFKQENCEDLNCSPGKKTPF